MLMLGATPVFVLLCLKGPLGNQEGAGPAAALEPLPSVGEPISQEGEKIPLQSLRVLSSRSTRAANNMGGRARMCCHGDEDAENAGCKQ